MSSSSSSSSSSLGRAFAPRAFGSAGITVGPLGLGSSFGLPAREVERAFDRGVDFFLWGSLRKRDFGLGLRRLAQANRGGIAIAVQSYTRFASLMEWSVDRALRFLRTDYVDVLTLSWWNGPPPARILDEARRLREKGKARAIMVSCHHRPSFRGYMADPTFDALMLRYNAAHPGAEREIFPYLGAEESLAVRGGRRPGTVAFTATRWGTLLDPRFLPECEARPRASDCYRFGLSNPNVDVCLAGPADAAQLDEALEALARGPLDEEEDAWMRRVGEHVREATATRRRLSPVDLLDRLVSFSPCAPKQLAGA